MADLATSINNADLLLEAMLEGIDKIKERDVKYFPDVDFKTCLAFAIALAADDIKDMRAVYGNNLIDVDQRRSWDLSSQEELEFYNDFGFKDVEPFDSDRYFYIQLDAQRRLEIFWNDSSFEKRGLIRTALSCPQKEIFKYNPDLDTLAIHPGIVLLKAFILPKKVNIEALARDLRFPQDKFMSLLKGKRLFPEGISDSLSRIFKTTQLFWTKLNSNYINHGLISQNYYDIIRIVRKYNKR